MENYKNNILKYYQAEKKKILNFYDNKIIRINSVRYLMYSMKQEYIFYKYNNIGPLKIFNNDDSTIRYNLT